MKNTIDLLIMFTDGAEIIITGVSDYKYDKERTMFSFEKNGFRSFVPPENVKYFGAPLERTTYAATTSANGLMYTPN